MPETMSQVDPLIIEGRRFTAADQPFLDSLWRSDRPVILRGCTFVDCHVWSTAPHSRNAEYTVEGCEFEYSAGFDPECSWI